MRVGYRGRGRRGRVHRRGSRRSAAPARGGSGWRGRLEPGAGEGEGGGGQPPPAFPDPGDPPRRPQRRRCALAAMPNHLHAEQVRAVPRRREARRLREAAGARHRRPPTCSPVPKQPARCTLSASTSASIRSAIRRRRWYGPARSAGRCWSHGGYIQDWLLLETDWNWRLESEKAGRLRAVADIGSHWLDLARFVTGQRITEVMADLHTLIPVRRHPPGPVETFAKTSESDDLIEEEMTSDDAAGVLLRFEDGARASSPSPRSRRGRKNSLNLEVDGSAAALSWYSEDPDRLWIGHRGRPNEIMAARPGAGHRRCRSPHRVSRRTCGGLPRHLPGAIRRGLRRGRRGRQPENPRYPTFADGHDAVRGDRSGGSQF